MSSNGEPNKILIISQYFFPTAEKNYEVKETIEKLAEQGHNISVIARKSSAETVSEIKNTKFYFIEQDAFTSGSEWGYVFQNISFMWKAIKIGSAIEGNFDMVIATMPTGFAGIAANIVAGKKGAKLYLDVKENWVESALAANYISNGSPIHKAAIMVENWVLKRGEKFIL